MQRIQKRRAGQRQTQNALIGLLSAVSMTRIGLTQLLPLCGSAAWWLSARVYAAGAVRLRRFSAAPAPNAHADADRLCPKVAGKFWRHPDYARADPPAPAGRRCVPHGAHHIFHRGHRCARLAVHADAADGVSDADCPEPRWTAARCLPAPACAVCRRCDYRHQRAFGCAPGRHRAALGRRRAAAAERHPAARGA